MNRELQDFVWQKCLPKEFKEEVNGMYNGYQPEKIRECLIMLFGHHNLTSDANGEENDIDLAKLNEQLDAALNSETKESLEEWMERDDNTRLQIAAQLLSGLLASGKEKHPVGRAFELTDALMAENKKR